MKFWIATMNRILPLLLSTVFIHVAHGAQLLDQEPISCHELHTQQSEISPARVCFRRHSNDDDDRLVVVDYQLDAREGWKLESAYLWMGTNLTDVPLLVDEGNQIPSFELYPFQQTTEGGLSSPLQFENFLKGRLGVLFATTKTTTPKSSWRRLPPRQEMWSRRNKSIWHL